MADASAPSHRPTESVLARQAKMRASRAETTAMGCFGLGTLLLLIGILLALLQGGGWVFLWLGGIIFLAGCIENMRAELLRLRAKLEQD